MSSVKNKSLRSSLVPLLVAGAAALLLIACKTDEVALSDASSAQATASAQQTAQAGLVPTPSTETGATTPPTAMPTPVSFLGPIAYRLPDLKTGPIDVPLEIKIPSLGVSAPILGVGITAEGAMDSPKGPANDPIWNKAYWYRGSSAPGDPGVAALAGHYNGREGIPALFYELEDIKKDDLITIRHTENGKEVTYRVTEVKEYTVKETQDPKVLARIYGEGPVAGRGPQPSADGLSHITLITCSGKYVNGSFDHRFVVYASQISL